MGWEAWFTIAVITFCFAAMAIYRVSPDTALMGGITLLLVSGILSPAEAFVGLSNEGVITVAILYVVVAGLKEDK